MTVYSDPWAAFQVQVFLSLVLVVVCLLNCARTQQLPVGFGAPCLRGNFSYSPVRRDSRSRGPTASVAGRIAMQSVIGKRGPRRLPQRVLRTVRPAVSCLK